MAKYVDADALNERIEPQNLNKVLYSKKLEIL